MGEHACLIVMSAEPMRETKLMVQVCACLSPPGRSGAHGLRLTLRHREVALEGVHQGEQLGRLEGAAALAGRDALQHPRGAR